MPDGSGSPDDQGLAMSHVRVETGLDRSGVLPGGAATIGVRFIIDEGWHLYWRNNGDSGMPISVTFEAPEGVHIGPIQWPAPERHVYGFGSVDYIYEHETALLAPIEIDDRFQPGDRIAITASFELLACQEACVAGFGSREVLIGIAESTTMSEPEWMKKTRRRIPGLDQSPLAIRWDGSDLLISAYDREQIRSMVYFPLSPSERRPTNPEVDGITETGLLRVAYPRQIIGAPSVAGVVEIVGPDGPVWIEIETTPPEIHSDRGDANEPQPAQKPHQLKPHQPKNDRSGD